MQHISNWLLLFYILVMAMLLPAFLKTDAADAAQIDHTQYAERLTSAAHSAVLSVHSGKASVTGDVWGDREEREEAVNTFFHTLSTSFSSEKDETDLKVSVPAIVLVDNSGFYVAYNALFDPSYAATRNDIRSAEYGNVDSIQISGLIPWGEEFTHSGVIYYIQYTLQDDVTVVSGRGATYKGNRRKVAKEIIRDTTGTDPTDAAMDAYLSSMTHGSLVSGTDPDAVLYLYADNSYTDGPQRGYSGGYGFTERKQELIVRTVNRQVNYYVNEKNYAAGTSTDNISGYKNYHEGYQIEMASVQGEDWHRLLQNPTFLSFLQGKKISTGETMINTYAYSGGEIVKDEGYFICRTPDPATGIMRKYYHSISHCTAPNHLAEMPGHTTGGTTDESAEGFSLPADSSEYGIFHFIYDGGDTYISTIYPSTSECAKLGALPCPVCVK